MDILMMTEMAQRWDENGNTWNYNDARKEFGM